MKTLFQLFIAGVAAINIFAQGTPAGRPSIETFQIVVRRNIFDPARQPYTPTQPPAKVETFTFRGAALCGDAGYQGFFEGDGVPQSGRLAVNDAVNGFVIQSLTLTEAELVNTNTPSHEVLILKDQTGLTRTDGSVWTRIRVPVSYRKRPDVGQTGVGTGRRFLKEAL
jgi:hypothetical protein